MCLHLLPIARAQNATQTHASKAATLSSSMVPCILFRVAPERPRCFFMHCTPFMPRHTPFACSQVGARAEAEAREAELRAARDAAAAAAADADAARRRAAKADAAAEQARAEAADAEKRTEVSAAVAQVTPDPVAGAHRKTLKRRLLGTVLQCH